MRRLLAPLSTNCFVGLPRNGAAAKFSLPGFNLEIYLHNERDTK